MKKWKHQPIYSVGKVVTGSTPRTSEDSFYGGEIPFITPAELDQNDPVTTATRTLSESGGKEARLLPEGAVMVCCIGSLGKIGIAGRTVVTNQQINSVVFDVEKILPRFGFHACRLLKSQLITMAPATTVAIVSKSKFEKLEIPVPPIAEQKRIAEILDRTQSIISKRKEAIAKLDTLTQSIFLEMFGDLGTNLSKWEILQLQVVVKRGTIVTYGIVQAGEEFPNGIPYIRTGDITNGQIDKSGLRHTNPQIAAKFERSRVKTDDIVMSIRATVGTTAIVPPELDGANLTQGTAKIAPGDSVDRLYLLNYLRTSKTQHWISQQVKGATFREITLTRLRELPVAIPPLPLQKEFAQRVEAVEKLKATHRASLSELQALFASLQHRAFRGEL